MRTRVTSLSQPYRLRERLEEANVAHGQEIRADLAGVRVTASVQPLAGLRQWLRPDSERSTEGDVYFCTMGRIHVRAVMQNGDGRPLPESVVLDGFEVAEPGTYDIQNALIQSNGRIRVVVDRESRVTAAAAPAGHY